MKRLYVLAALLMATTSAHAGNSISFEIEGHRIRIEAPRNCDELSCIQISAPGLSGSGFGGWEENKGNVRIEECGKYLCGYAVNSGEKILINMRPQDSKWTGRIHDPDSGQNYDSTIAMKGTSALRVQGCAFGGMFCGGQIWKRVS